MAEEPGVVMAEEALKVYDQRHKIADPDVSTARASAGGARRSRGQYRAPAICGLVLSRAQ
jgi:hypothetical protein